MNFLIAPQRVHRLVQQNRKPEARTTCECGHPPHAPPFTIICVWCKQIEYCEPWDSAVSDETTAQLDSMYKGYAEP